MKKNLCILFCVISGMLNSFLSATAQTLQYVEPTEALTYDPLNVEDRISLHLSSLMYNSLVSTDPNFNLRPELLENLTPISAEKGVYRFKLRAGVKWVGYDKKKEEVVVLGPFTAGDVAYTFQQIRDSQNPTSYNHLKYLFKDVRQIANDVVEFEVMSNKLELDLDFIIRSLQFAIIPAPSKLKGVDLALFKGQPVVGTAPFVMTEEGFNRVRLNKNKHFFRFNNNPEDSAGRMEISRIEMNARIDSISITQSLITPRRPSLYLVTEIPLELYSEANKSQNITMPIHGTNSFTFIAYNCGGAFRDKRLRLAFTHALNRKEIFRNVYGEIYAVPEGLRMQDIPQIIHCPLPPDQTPTDIPMIEWDIDTAKRYLEEIRADKDPNKDDIRAKMKEGFQLLAYIENAHEDRICQAFATQISQNLGIQIRVVNMPKAEWLRQIGNRDFEIAFGRVFFNHDVNVIDNLFHSNSPQNFVQYKNDEIDKRLDEYNRANHPEMRDKIKKEMAEMIAKDVPYTFLYRIPKYAAYRNDVLGGVEIHPYYFFSFIENWYMKPQR